MYSIILPCLNEKDNLKLLISEIQNILKNINFEIIIIDDNSEDGTEKMITENFSKMQNLMFIKRENKIRSLGKSVLEGLLKAKNDYIIVMDSDFNHDPNDLLEIIKIQTKHHYDLICCSRYTDKKSNFLFTEFSFVIQNNLFIYFISFFLQIK
jgi:dolichol-phosphate mannosyltransferase